MNETRGSGGGGLAGVGLLLAAALLGALAYALHLIGGLFLQKLALIFVIALAVGVVLIASALPIRAWRRKDFTGAEHHYHHDGTQKIIERERVLDGRMIEAPKLYQLPAQPQGGAFPSLIQAAFQAGALAPRSTVTQYDGARREADVYPGAYAAADGFDQGPAPDGWEGDIG